MVLKTQSTKTPVAGPPTTAVRKPLVGTRHQSAQVLRVAPHCHPHGLSMAQACPIKSRHFVAGPTPNETNETHCRYKKCVFSYDQCLICTLPRYDFCPCRGYTVRRNRDTMSHPIHRLAYSCRPKRTRYNDVTNVTGISYENAENRELCVSPLTKAKLTRSCAGPNPGAIKYIQFTTDITLEVNERYKPLALEHHKRHKIQTSKASNAGCHAKTSGKAARGS